MGENSTTWNRDDRDLLVELRTEMRGVREDIKKIANGNDSRLKALEQGKLDRSEAVSLQNEAFLEHKNFEQRIRTLEDESKILKAQIRTWLTIGGLFLAVAQIAIQMAFDYLTN